MDVRTACTIDRPPDEVRAQFADVEYHALARVHRNVRFEPLGPQRFRQITRRGPLRLRQEIEIDHRGGDLVHRVVDGSLRGSTLTFGFEPAGSGGTAVTATAQVPLRGPSRLAGPLLAQSMRRALRVALEEDRLDLESTRYAERHP